MRILHTSDWHLGSTLESVSRDRDHGLFLDWLAGRLAEHQVEVLVIAGDIFDVAQPSAEATRLYFSFLHRVAVAGNVRKVVVVGGNHDSASRLDAPRDVLGALEVHVVGGLPDPKDLGRCVCPISLGRSGVDAVALAVPYVNEIRLGLRSALEGGEFARELRERFTFLYRSLADQAEQLAPGRPIFATGHLACVGSKRDDAPAEIHLIGAIGGMSPDIFDPRIGYVALGHIHRSFHVAQSRAHYSGSPIALSSKELAPSRKVLLVDLPSGPGGEPVVSPIEVPTFRHILQLKGACDFLTEQLQTLHWEAPLEPLVYAIVQSERVGAGVEALLHAAAQANPHGPPRLIQVRPLALPTAATPAEDRPPPTRLSDLSAEEVFLRLCASKGVPADEQLLQAFRSVLSAPGSEKAGPE